MKHLFNVGLVGRTCFGLVGMVMLDAFSQRLEELGVQLLAGR